MTILHYEINASIVETSFIVATVQAFVDTSIAVIATLWNVDVNLFEASLFEASLLYVSLADESLVDASFVNSEFKPCEYKLLEMQVL